VSAVTKNNARLRRLRAAIDEESPVDGIHNPDVDRLYSDGGRCPRLLGCTSEGHWDSSYRGNPDFFAGNADEVADWLRGSYEEGWAGRWVRDLDTGDAIAWTVAIHFEVRADGR
jgi:hypothetical protein